MILSIQVIVKPSKSKYRLIGSIRSIAITLSYEICMAIVFLSPVFMINTLSLNIFNHYYLNSMLYTSSVVMWIMCILAECNRAPFDIVEAESELVSGFNIEYRSSEFVLLFMREYSRLLILSSIASLIFIRVSYYGSIYIFSLITFYRSVYPRYRYDHLMQLTWLYLLPLSIFQLEFSSVCYYLHVFIGIRISGFQNRWWWNTGLVWSFISIVWLGSIPSLSLRSCLTSGTAHARGRRIPSDLFHQALVSIVIGLILGIGCCGINHTLCHTGY